MIEITARAGPYRKGLLAAIRQLSPQEAVIVSDLERHGLQVTQLHDLLCGGHVLIDDPELYTSWQFAKVSHRDAAGEDPGRLWRTQAAQPQ